jgi:hypothetical protein
MVQKFVLRLFVEGFLPYVHLSRSNHATNELPLFGAQNLVLGGGE